MTALRRMAGLGSLGAALTAGPALGEPAVALGGETPLVCSAGLSGQVSGGSLGQLSEFCNDPDGYDVYVDYPASLTGSTLFVDGAPVALTSQGEVQVTHAAGPGSARLTLALDTSSTGQVSLTIRMVPVDATSFALATAP